MSISFVLNTLKQMCVRDVALNVLRTFSKSQERSQQGSSNRLLINKCAKLRQEQHRTWNTLMVSCGKHIMARREPKTASLVRHTDIQYEWVCEQHFLEARSLPWLEATEKIIDIMTSKISTNRRKAVSGKTTTRYCHTHCPANEECMGKRRFASGVSAWGWQGTI